MDNSPVTQSVKLKWLRCPLPVPPRLCSLITSLKNGFKRLQMEEQWHLSLANEGPAVTSKGELHSVMLIVGYFSADFIPGVSGKMSSLCWVLLLQAWSDSPGVDMEPPKISLGLFSFAHVTWNEQNSTAALPSLHEELFSLMFGLSQTRVLLYLFHLQLCWASLSGWGLIWIRQSFDSKVLVKMIKLFETSPSLGSGASFCWSLRTTVSCTVKQNLSRMFDLRSREHYYSCLGIHSCFICSFFHGTTFPNRWEWEKRE